MIRIDTDSSKSIYQQVYEEFVRLIISKVLKPNEKIPSVRELAATIRINPNTIYKAYKLLEKDDYIDSIQGKGYYVKERKETIDVYLEEIKKKLKIIIKKLKLIDLSDEQILNLIKSLMEGDE